jgi:chromosome segregation ATPase
LYKTIQDLNLEIETIKQSGRDTTLEMENLRKRAGVIDESIINTIQEKVYGIEDTIEDIETTVKQITKSNKLLTENNQEIQDKMNRPKLRIIGIEESKDAQLKGLIDTFNKIREENFPNLKKELRINGQEPWKTQNRLNQKRNSSFHIIIKTLNV